MENRFQRSLVSILIRGCLKRRPLCYFDFFLIYFVYFVEKTLKKISTKHTKEESKAKKDLKRSSDQLLRRPHSETILHFQFSIVHCFSAHFTFLTISLRCLNHLRSVFRHNPE